MFLPTPPYGVSYQTQSGKFGVIKGDKKRHDALYALLVNSLRQLAKHAENDAAFYIWHASSTRKDFEEAMAAAGIEEKQYLIWAKPSIVLGHADYHWAHEPCFYGAKVGTAPAFHGDRKQQTVWRIAPVSADAGAVIGPGVLILDGNGRQIFIQPKAPKGKKVRTVRLAGDVKAVVLSADESNTDLWEIARDSGAEHPTQKPVELAARGIENSTAPGGLVCDAFLGSGTTLIAAETTGRVCFGSELDPVYADVIVQRWQRIASAEATLEGDGRTFAEIAKERTKKGEDKR